MVPTIYNRHLYPTCNTFSVLYGTERVAKLAKPKSKCSICLTYAIIALNSWGGLILGHYSCVYITKWTIKLKKFTSTCRDEIFKNQPKKI